jgi:hypothetical protein
VIVACVDIGSTFTRAAHVDVATGVQLRRGHAAGAVNVVAQGSEAAAVKPATSAAARSTAA